MKKKIKNSKFKKFCKFLVKQQKKILFILILFILLLFIIFIVKYFNSNNGLSIEIASNNVNYIYGPNNSTLLKVGVNESVDLKVLTVKGKESKVKCYSSDNELVSFIDSNSFKTLKEGETEIHCKLVNNVSNKISLVIGE